MRVFFVIAILLITTAFALGQTASNDPWPPISGQRRSDDDSRIVKEMLSKQQAAREKKEYEELLDRAKTAVKLCDDLARSLSRKTAFTDSEKKRLAEYEELLEKIRRDLGGDDDGGTSLTTDKKAKPPRDVREGVLYLKSSTESLLDELKRSTRFSISVAAIETSNTLIRLARFLRLKS